jgi:hypothetical protein
MFVVSVCTETETENDGAAEEQGQIDSWEHEAVDLHLYCEMGFDQSTSQSVSMAQKFTNSFHTFCFLAVALGSTAVTYRQLAGRHVWRCGRRWNFFHIYFFGYIIMMISSCS